MYWMRCRSVQRGRCRLGACMRVVPGGFLPTRIRSSLVPALPAGKGVQQSGPRRVLRMHRRLLLREHGPSILLVVPRGSRLYGRKLFLQSLQGRPLRRTVRAASMLSLYERYFSHGRRAHGDGVQRLPQGLQPTDHWPGLVPAVPTWKASRPPWTTLLPRLRQGLVHGCLGADFLHEL